MNGGFRPWAADKVSMSLTRVLSRSCPGHRSSLSTACRSLRGLPAQLLRWNSHPQATLLHPLTISQPSSVQRPRTSHVASLQSGLQPTGKRRRQLRSRP